nr:MAG TPA: Protein of unknown function (DUF2633) [Caudoviricetes sp.]
MLFLYPIPHYKGLTPRNRRKTGRITLLSFVLFSFLFGRTFFYASPLKLYI